MDLSQASITATIGAYVRGYHHVHCANPIFEDPLAMRLFRESEVEAIEANLVAGFRHFFPDHQDCHPDEALAFMMTVMGTSTTCSRSRFAEDGLSEVVSMGARQYVIVGAGLDTYAFRNQDPNVMVYEVDHPVTQAAKMDRIENLGWPMPHNLRFVPLDLSDGDLSQALHDASYQRDMPAYFSLLGLTMYLEPDALSKTLQAIASVSTERSTIVFDYFDTDALDPEKQDQSAGRMQAIGRGTGEALVGTFAPDQLATFLGQAGFSLIQNMSPADIQDLYFKNRTDGLNATPHLHLAKAIRSAKALDPVSTGFAKY